MEEEEPTLEEEEIEEEPCIDCTIHSAKYELCGRLQGVFFRNHAVDKAKELGVKGYIRNNEKGRVEGVLQGEEEEFEQMKVWLSAEGSPDSRIDTAEWTEEKLIPEYAFEDFTMKA